MFIGYMGTLSLLDGPELAHILKGWGSEGRTESGFLLLA